LVSLPFADHCEPLLSEPGDFPKFTNWLKAECDLRRWKYVEFRPLTQQAANCVLQPSHSYCLHSLDLEPSLERLFRNLHKNSIQRKIRRAERERLSCEVGGLQLLDEFYRLQLITRKRLRVLPQPRSWFENLLRCMGDNAQIRLARKDGKSIAALLTLRHKASVIYKYGCSEEQFHRLGAMPFLFWSLIEDSKVSGV
jgi:lipid II:glycine glycyltransferase (peptidoglycan interpeptide bridge formation enzyme)